jgi:cytoskeletal protein CcmA (bactofilin family)
METLTPSCTDRPRAAATRPPRKHRAFVFRASDRRGVSFCYALITLTVMLTLGMVFVEIGLNSAKWAYSHYRDSQAFYLSEAALDRATWMMQQSASGEDNINTALTLSDADAQAGVTKTYTSADFTVGDGTCRFTAVAPYQRIPRTVQITATGITPGGMRKDVLKVVRADTNGGSGNVLPAPCFAYGVFSDHNMTMTGNPTVKGHPENGGSGLYSNGNLSLTGNPTIYGPVSATGTITVTGNFNQIPSNAGRNAHCPRLAMPTIDLAHYQSIADEVWGTGGTVSMSGNISAPLGTLEHPKIIYVNGTLKLTGNVTMSGIGIIVASKGVTVTGNVTYGSPGNDAWGFATAGSFKITGNAQVYGSIYCHNATGDADFTATGNANVYGSIAADVVTFTGNYMVEWNAASRGLANMPGSTVQNGPPSVASLVWKRL